MKSPANNADIKTLNTLQGRSKAIKASSMKNPIAIDPKTAHRRLGRKGLRSERHQPRDLSDAPIEDMSKYPVALALELRGVLRHELRRDPNPRLAAKVRFR